MNTAPVGGGAFQEPLLNEPAVTAENRTAANDAAVVVDQFTAALDKIGRDMRVVLEQGTATLDADTAKDVNDKLIALEENSGTDFQSLMMFFHKMVNLMRRQAREQRWSMRDAQMGELQNAADHLRDAATKQMWAGIAMGAATIAAGAVTMGGSFSAARSMKGAGTATKGGGGIHDLNAMATQSQITMGKWSGIGQVLQGTGQIVSSAITAEAEFERANQQEAEARATKAEALAQDETDLMNGFRDLLKDIQDKLQNIYQTRHETRKSILKV
jgi:predicted transcriptional regulator